MTLAAVIVHYHAPALAAACIRSLRAGTRIPDRIVVIDNGSEPGLRETLSAAWPGVEIRSSGQNAGFAGALGPDIAELGDRILVLNQDCELEPRCAELLEAALADPRVAIACGTVLDPGGRVWSRGAAVDGTGRARNHQDSAEVVDYAPGCAMLVRADAWREAGGLDPLYFMYFEDADLATRLRHSGWRVVCEPRAICRHEGSSAAGDEHARFQSYFRLRNRTRFVARNSGPLERAAFVFFILPALLARDLLRYARLGRLSAYVEVLRGLSRVTRTAQPPSPDPGHRAPPAYVYRKAHRRALARIVDGVGYAFAARRAQERPARVDRILVVKLDHLGDVVLALPAIEALRATYRSAEIDVLVSPAAGPLLATAAINRVEELPAPWLRGGHIPWRAVRSTAKRLRERRYDLALDLRGDPIAILIGRRAARFAVGIGNAGLGFLLDRVHPGPRP
ncbi:MAG TPA: glycosyltransferase, partial [Candidatus Polarisedimenticolaceae bacterium]|nr:glycosyltransferase [Candidatus Polarisedimenticolaceae bacterium]